MTRLFRAYPKKTYKKKQSVKRSTYKKRGRHPKKTSSRGKKVKTRKTRKTNRRRVKRGGSATPSASPTSLPVSDF